MIEPTPLQEVLPDSETCWALLERVAASTQLKRASRLRELLFFIGRRSLKDGCDQVHEQEIGCAVFGRPDAYDTSVDNIVRASVSDLRKRIEVFFDSEGMHEALIMEIPAAAIASIFTIIWFSRRCWRNLRSCSRLLSPKHLRPFRRSLQALLIGTLGCLPD